MATASGFGRGSSEPIRASVATPLAFTTGHARSTATLAAMRMCSSVVLLLALGCGPTPASATTTAPDSTAAAPASVPAREPVAARTIVIVRHAEKQSEDPNAELSAVGHARAQCLAKVLGDAAVTHVFATEFKRTQDTVAPLAARHSLTPTVIPANEGTRWIDTLRSLAPGSIAVVAGHSNSIPAVLAELGASQLEVAHDAYDWMFVLSLPAEGAPVLLRTHYCPG
jgi:phosphohistidine phosphatase SixA